MSETTVLFNGPYFRVLRRRRWDYAERLNTSGIVLIIPLTDDGCIIFNEQFRIPVDRPVIELPAGIVGDLPGQGHESLAEGARRELLEETGYEAATMEYLTEGPPSAGITNEVLSLFLAKGVTRVASGGGDESENIVVHRVPLAEAHDWLRAQEARGCYLDPKVFIGLYFASTRW